MTPLNFNNPEHKAIIISAMVAADVMGVGRFTAIREQLELNGIEITDTTKFERAVFSWGAQL
jgi:hypothetical protein